jgi:type I restriction enzyme S subunit
MAEMKFNEWYEPTPADWMIQRMKNIMSPREEKSIDGEEELLSVTINEGIIKRTEYLDEDEGTSRADSLVGYKVVSPTNLVNNIMKMSFRCLGVSTHEGIVSPAYSVFELNHSKVDPTYLNFLLRIDRYVAEYRKLSKGIQESRMRLYDDFFLAMKVIVPPLDEQKRISHYLDKKTTQIDSLINKIEKKIELLKEQRTSLINQYVTKGLDPNVEMKDSGIEWIGEIPNRWKKVPIKHLFKYQKGGRAQLLTQEYIQSNPGPYPVFSGSTTSEGIGSIDDFDFDFNSVIHVSTVGSEKIMSTQILRGKFSLSQNCLILIPKAKISVEFIHWVLETNFTELRKQLPKILQLSFRYEDLDNISLFIPELSEQLAIVGYATPKIQRIDRLSERENSRINLLKEYRQSLISSIVTGKVRVTEDML